MKCPEHKTYLGAIAPKSRCYKCWFIWLWNHENFSKLFKELGGDSD